MTLKNPPALIADALDMGAKGAPHSEAERELFEAYMMGHCWAVSDWDAKKRCYQGMNTRMLFAVFRDRAALAVLQADKIRALSAASEAEVTTATAATTAMTATAKETAAPEDANNDAFDRAWMFMQARGYQYGRDALENVRMGWNMRERAQRPGNTSNTSSNDCANCHKCLDGKFTEEGLPVLSTRMILCPACGNKRCPKASDHALACTQSNEPGQPGSVHGRTQSSPPPAQPDDLCGAGA